MLKAVIEGTRRCILRYVPERGWSATRDECKGDDEVDWLPSPKLAVEGLVSRFESRIELAESDVEVLQAVEDKKERWACEWWHGSDGTKDGEWLRPFEVPA